MAVDAFGKVAATGELHANPELHLWDARTAEQIIVFRDIHRRGITSLSFSKAGDHLVSLGQDLMHSLVVFRSPSKRWFDGHVLFSTSVSPAKMLWTAYVDVNEFPIVVGGTGTIFFFRPSGMTAERIRGVFGKRKKLQPILCGVEGEPAGTQSSILTGTVTGHIYVWTNHRISSTITAHESPINAMTKLRKGYATAGKEGLVKLWSPTLQLLHTYNMQTFSPQPAGPSIHALRTNIIGSKMVVGMRTGEIFEISLPTHTYMLLVEGHSYRELHGLDVNPVNSDEYATVGDDGIVRVWSYAQRMCTKRISVEAAGRALAYFPDGMRIIVGLGGDPTQATKDGGSFSALSLILFFYFFSLQISEFKFLYV